LGKREQSREYHIFSLILNKKLAIENRKKLSKRKEDYESRINAINNSSDSQDVKNKKTEALEDFKEENDAIESMANDSSTYQLRKRMLVEMQANSDAGESNEDYHLATSNTFSYGNIQEHAELENDYNNNLISGNEGDKIGMDLVNGKSVEGSEEDAIDDMIRKGSVMYVGSKNQFVSVTDGKVTAEKTNQILAPGQLYYRHESNSGQPQLVKINRQTLSASPKVIKDLMKYFKMGLENAGEDSNEIQDIDIEIKDGEFLGIFDNVEKPKRLKELISLFAAIKNSPGEAFTEPYLVSKERDCKSRASLSARLHRNEREESNSARMQFFKEEEAAEESVKEKIVDFSIVIGNLKLNKTDSLEDKLAEIESSLGKLRYYMNQQKFRTKKGKGFEVNKKAYKAIIKSGLVTHGFNVKENFDKIFSKKNGQGENRNVKIVLRPIDSGMVSRAVLNHRNAKAKERTIQTKPDAWGYLE
jgi:hypothetical protein